jgi:AraC-like DNA-binding protein
MPAHPSGSGGIGLERSCAEGGSDWLRSTTIFPGVELFEAWFRGSAYRQHRHDTYAIGVTETGLQAFAYGGATHRSVPGQVVVLHPDESHDGRAGSAAGFGYRQLYVEPSLVLAAMRELRGKGATLPFAREPVTVNETLARAIRGAFEGHAEPLAGDGLVLRLTEGLLEADSGITRTSTIARLDVAAVERARQLLDAETSRVVRSDELEAVSGLTRFDLARQFRAVVGASPYRYSVMRRLEAARFQIGRQGPLVDVALNSGFADQAHFTRMFTARYGITPGRYQELRSRGADLR